MKKLLTNLKKNFFTVYCVKGGVNMTNRSQQTHIQPTTTLEDVVAKLIFYSRRKYIATIKKESGRAKAHTNC